MGDPATTLQVRNEIAPFQFDFCDTSKICAKAIIGAKGSGKTWIGARFVAKMVDEMPGSKGIFACSTNTQAEDIWEQDIQTLLDDLNWDYVWNKNKGIVRFANGTMMHIRTAEKPERIESIQYQWGWQDEVSLASKEFCKTIRSRIRGINGQGHARFTSMPDDPEHFIYDYLEDVCDSFHEVTLQDNPDKSFVAAYTKLLKEIYSGAELDRYLFAKRISLTGLGLFAAQNHHKVDADYASNDDLYLVWDFNVEYRAVTAWQQKGFVDKLPLMNCINSFQMKQWTTADDARELCKFYKGHKALIYLHGDASGDNRSAQATDSMWKQIKKVFEEKFPDQIRYVVPKSNPNVKNTIQCTNWALKQDCLQFSDAANIAYRYLVAAKADKYGEIDKSVDNEEGGAKSHEVDTIRYLAWHIYRKFFPGAKTEKVKKAKIRGF